MHWLVTIIEDCCQQQGLGRVCGDISLHCEATGRVLPSKFRSQQVLVDFREGSGLSDQSLLYRHQRGLTRCLLACGTNLSNRYMPAGLPGISFPRGWWQRAQLRHQHALRPVRQPPPVSGGYQGYPRKEGWWSPHQK